MVEANAWIKNYCVRRASDTYLTAIVRLTAARERANGACAIPSSSRARRYRNGGGRGP